MVCGDLKYDSKRPFAVEGVVNAAYDVIGQSILLLRNAWPKTLQVLWVFRNEGLILAALFGLSAFFPMAETSITNLWPSRSKPSTTIANSGNWFSVNSLITQENPLLTSAWTSFFTSSHGYISIWKAGSIMLSVP
nr:putative DUF21 domain-containing protein At3g13070, chloroplastic isoform X1 [Ziziphus jujuba var. spinosa]